MSIKSEEMSQLQYQNEIEEEKVSIEKLTAHGISLTDVKRLKDAGINTFNDLLKLTSEELIGTGVAKVDKICEAARFQTQVLNSGSDVLPKMKVLCDKAFGHNVLEKRKQEIAVKQIEKVLYDTEEVVQLVVTSCTASLLVKENGILQNWFSTEWCGHDPSIDEMDCVVKTAKALKIPLATGSEVMFPKLLYNARGIPLVYAVNINNMHLCPATSDSEKSSSDSERSSSSEDVPIEKKRKNPLKTELKSDTESHGKKTQFVAKKKRQASAGPVCEDKNSEASAGPVRGDRKSKKKSF